MRLMLCRNNTPELLVNIRGTDTSKFTFYVVNGCWEGTFDNGSVTVDYDKTVIENVEILCAEQDRLRGPYQDVFNNFDDPSWISPESKFVPPVSGDDDIPF